MTSKKQNIKCQLNVATIKFAIMIIGYYFGYYISSDVRMWLLLITKSFIRWFAVKTLEKKKKKEEDWTKIWGKYHTVFS